MINNMKFNQIIQFKLDGYSDRETAKLCGVDRKTVKRRFQQYNEDQLKLLIDKNDKQAKEHIAKGRKYNTSKRKPYVYNQEIENIIVELIQDDIIQKRELGTNKLRLTGEMVYAEVIRRGHKISLSTVKNNFSRLKCVINKVFIRQHYCYGDRAEFDYGEVNLIIGGQKTKVYLAVISCPASNFRFVHIYNNQGMSSFKDAHVRFFEQVGGVYSEMCYDNMRNVVKKFIGKNEKELNDQLIQLSNYYGFKINVTNAFSGNEKGHVEGSVKYVRNQLFARNYKFKDLDEINSYAFGEMIRINSTSNIYEEANHLRPYKPPFEVATYYKLSVNKYSFITINKKFYSVPEKYVGKTLSAKVYEDVIKVYDLNEFIIDLKPITGSIDYRVDILHYQSTLLKKPGAINRSLALHLIPELKQIFDIKYKDKPREFITTIIDNKDLPINEICTILERNITNGDKLIQQDDMMKKVEDGYASLNKLMEDDYEKFNVN